jgi:TolB-like protein/Flp pilus assembly protein TadD
MQPSGQKAYHFEGFTLDLTYGSLHRADQEIELRPKSFETLRYLVENAGRLVPKDELASAVWRNVVVADESITRCISDIRLAIGDSNRRLIRTVPRRGYRFAATVSGRAAEPSSINRELQPLGVAQLSAETESRLLPDKPSLAVLPFENLTGDAEQEYFVDGIVEEITTAVARLPRLFVIARNSAFTYKGKAVDVRQVAQELGVRYVLEGSVRKAGNRVRIAGQLIDTTTGAHIWADCFEGPLDDIFALQDQVASSVAGAIHPKLRQSEIERARRKSAADLTAYDLFLRASAQSYRFTEEGLAEAVLLFRQALTIDPSYAPAAAKIGWCRTVQWLRWRRALSDEEIGEACDLARQALRVGRDDSETVTGAARTLFFLAGEVAMAAAALDRALALNPNAARAWSVRGFIHAMCNQPEAAIEANERACRLSPFDPLTFFSTGNIALAHLVARRFEPAIEWADRTLCDRPRMVEMMRYKAAAYAHLGRLDEARIELNRMLAIDPEATIADFREYARFMAPEVLELFVTGLRLAGLPEE